MDLSKLSAACRKKMFAHLVKESGRGAPLTQAQMDFIHMETSETNLAYWAEQLQEADDNDSARIMHCDQVRRSILLALRAQEPPVCDMDDDPKRDGLSGFLAEIDLLPSTH